MSDMNATGTGGPNRARRRHSQTQQPATLKLINTQKRTVERILIVEDCVLCGGTHRHRDAGLRVSGCRKGVYRVVAA